MLTDCQRDIIKSTVPLLEAGGEALTSHFYKMMLNEYPAVRPLFNQTHQANGSQARALANAVLRYARNIDHLENLGPLASQIVNKHVSLQIQPEHYPVVGTCLLRSIRQVLGAEIASDEVISAWAAAYQQLADILIGAEIAAYETIANAPGGWRGGRAFRVAAKTAESAEITSFYLEPADAKPVMSYLPGQYICLLLTIDGKEYRRNYSLSAAPNGRDYRISVKKEHAGMVSGYLHDRVNVEDILTLFPPAGDFRIIPGEKPLVLISGGVGITPTIAMLQASLGTSRPVTFINYARSAEVQAFRQTVAEWQAEHKSITAFWVTEQVNPENLQGRPDKQRLAEWLPADRDAEVYFLGPKPFMSFMKKTLSELGVPDNQLHYEFFGPSEALV